MSRIVLIVCYLLWFVLDILWRPFYFKYCWRVNSPAYIQCLGLLPPWLFTFQFLNSNFGLLALTIACLLTELLSARQQKDLHWQSLQNGAEQRVFPRLAGDDSNSTVHLAVQPH